MKLLILWLDALTLDDITEKQTPFLYALSRKHHIGGYVPDFGYSSSFAGLITGKTPNDHRQLFLFNPDATFRSVFSNIPQYPANIMRYMLGQTNFAPQLKGIFRGNFSPSPVTYYHHSHALPVPTLFDYCRKNHFTFTVYNWPLWGDNRCTKLTPFVSIGDESRTDYFIHAKENQSADVSFFHLWDFDHVSHKYGPNSPQTQNALRMYDQLAKNLFEVFQPEHFLIWSDHSMVPVKKIIDPTTEFNLRLAKHYFIDSTSLRTWFHNKAAQQEFEEHVLSFGRFLSSKDQAFYLIDHLRPQIFESMFVLKPGFVFSPSSFEHNPHIQSMHGYLPDELTPAQHPLFISNFSLPKVPLSADFYPEVIRIMGEI